MILQQRRAEKLVAAIDPGVVARSCPCPPLTSKGSLWNPRAPSRSSQFVDGVDSLSHTLAMAGVWVWLL